MWLCNIFCKSKDKEPIKTKMGAVTENFKGYLVNGENVNFDKDDFILIKKSRYEYFLEDLQEKLDLLVGAGYNCIKITPSTCPYKIWNYYVKVYYAKMKVVECVQNEIKIIK